MTEMGKRRTGGIPADALRDPVPPVKLTQMATIRPRVARGEPVALPLYGEAWMQPLGSAAMEEVEAETFAAMAKRGLPPVDLHVGTYNLHRFRRILARAVRDAKDHDQPFGSLDEWGEESDVVLTICILLYKDVQGRVDPVTDPQLTDEHAAAIIDAFKKKDFQELKSFGGVILASFLLSGAVQLSSSPTASSKSTDSLPE